MYKKIIMSLGLLTSLFSSTHVMSDPQKGVVNANDCPATLDFTLRELDGDKMINLCESYKGKVILIVNTASKCGFTSQFEALEELHEKYKDKGFTVLGFPSNDFGAQDPGSEQDIAQFCRLTYGVKFPMFEKTHAAKSKASPLYTVLGDMADSYPKWNFYKYLLNTEGELIANFSSFTHPSSSKLSKLIEENLPKK